MWPDVDTEIDFLNFSETAETAVDLIRQPGMLPLSLGIFGGWGAGKSTLLRLMEHELRNEAEGKDRNPYVIVKFDAWLFQDYDDARASLMEIIARTLWNEAEKTKTLVDKARGLLKRVNYLRALGTAVEVGASLALGVPPLGIFKRGVDALAKAFSGELTPADWEGVASEGVKLKQGINGWWPPAEKASPPEQIYAFRSEFTEVLKGLNKTLVVFIDNLDRCLPHVAIDTLEAIRLFLFLPNTSFVIAADEGMIRHAVSKHYQDLAGQHITDYLDKLIQVPLRVPLLGVQEVRAYMFLLFLSASRVNTEEAEKIRLMVCAKLRNSWKGDSITAKDITEALTKRPPGLISQLDLAERLAPVLANAPNITGNPRIVKRLLNTISMRLTLAKKHGMPLDEALLAKLAVFERCTDESAFNHLIKLINDAKEGKPEIFKSLEVKDIDTRELRDRCPKPWEKHFDFVEQWLGLEPMLASRDLRPAIYLSREKFPLAQPPSGLSERAANALQVLLATTKTTSVAAKKVVSGLTPTEQAGVMTALLSELKTITDWSKNPVGFAGAILLADSIPSVGEQLAAFIDHLPTLSVGPWMKPLIKQKKWAKDMMEYWEQTGRSPIRRSQSAGRSS